LRQKYFQPAGDGREKRYAVRSCLQELITWAPLNLVETWPMNGPFDVIFCRNVMIYFDRPTQSRLISRFEALLGAGGYLLVGHSEGFSGMATGLEYVQPSVYRKPSREAGS
jgi:chemotaxis protein methyltransferase CheR